MACFVMRPCSSGVRDAAARAWGRLQHAWPWAGQPKVGPAPAHVGGRTSPGLGLRRCLCPLPPVVHPLCPSDRRSSRQTCCSLRAEASWAQAQGRCGLGPGAALAMVDSPAVTALPWSPRHQVLGMGHLQGLRLPAAGGLQAAAAPVTLLMQRGRRVPAVVVARPGPPCLPERWAPHLQRAGQVWCGQCLPHLGASWGSDRQAWLGDSALQRSPGGPQSLPWPGVGWGGGWPPAPLGPCGKGADGLWVLLNILCPEGRSRAPERS